MSSQHGGSYIPGSSHGTGSVNVSNSNQQQSPQEIHGGNYIPGSAPSTQSQPVTPPDQHYGGAQIARRPVPSVHSGTMSPQSAVSQIDPYGQYNSYQYQGQSQYQTQPSYQTPQYQGQSQYQAPYSSHGISPARPSPYNSSGPSVNRGKAAGIHEEVKMVDVSDAAENGDISNRRDVKQPFMPLKGYKHLFVRPHAFRPFKHPHFYKPADHEYTAVERFKNKDPMLRLREGALDDRYISPYNGRTEELVVQAVDNIYEHSTSEGTWNRTFVRDISPWHLRIANWPESHIRYQDRMAGKVTKRQKLLKALKYIVGATALVAVIIFPGNVEGEIRNGGRYDVFPYKFHGYSKVRTFMTRVLKLMNDQT